MIWKVPEIWRGTSIVIGGGPSVHGIDCFPWSLREKFFSQRIIGVNNAGFIDRRVDVLFFGDSKWFGWNRDRLERHSSIIVTSHPSLEREAQNSNLFFYLKRKNGIGWGDKSQRSLVWNRSSGGSAIALARMLGSRRIVLFGFDMQRDKENKKNFHNEHRERPKTKAESNPWSNFMRGIAGLVKEAPSVGVELLNASTNTSISEKIIPRVDIKDVLADT